MTDNIIYKVIMTIGIVLIALGGSWGIANLFDNIKALFNGDFTLPVIFGIIFAIAMVLPGWYVWKGTGIFPLNFMFFIRIIVFIVAIFGIPFIIGLFKFDAFWIEMLPGLIIIGLGMVGLWVRS